MLLKVLSNVRFLARQAIPLRGGWNNESSSEINSNFTQLLMLRTEEDENFVQWLERKQMKYTSPEIQNEMIEIMALGLLRDIAKSIQLAEFYTIMVDETGDASNLEQLVLCLRWVDEELKIHEDFIGLHGMEVTDAKSIVNIIKDIIIRMGLKLKDARGQCYDGASAMRGKKNGVCTVIKELNPKCLFTHYYGHALNLAIGDSIKAIKLLSETFGTIKEVCKLIKKSPERETVLKKLRELSENED